MIVFDDLSPVERVKIFDKTIDNFEVKNLAINTSITNLTAGDILIPDINFSEPLKNSFFNFIQKINGEIKETLINNSEVTLLTAKILEDINREMVSV